MFRLITSSILAGLILSGCAIFGDKKEPIPIVKEQIIYQTVPQDILDKCPGLVILTPQQILEITLAEENKEVDSEELYNRYFVAPLYEGHEKCYLTIKEIEEWNKEAQRLNQKEEEISNE